MTTPTQPSTATTRRTARFVALALVLLGVCVTQEASAEFVPAPLPPGATSISNLAVLDGYTWAAHVVPAAGPQRVSVTTDRGATWTDLAGLLNPGDTVVGLAAAPGRTYRAVISLTNRPFRRWARCVSETPPPPVLVAPKRPTA